MDTYTLSEKEIYVRLLNSIYSRIDEKSAENCLKRGWDGYDSEPITEETCAHAKSFLDTLFYHHLLFDFLEVIPSPDGRFSFHYCKNCHLRIEITLSSDNDKTMLLWVGEDGSGHQSGIAFCIDEIEEKILKISSCIDSKNMI